MSVLLRGSGCIDGPGCPESISTAGPQLAHQLATTAVSLSRRPCNPRPARPRPTCAKPVGAARHVRKALAPDGTWLLVEPFAADRVEDNFNPVGRLYYSASVFLCVPNGLSQPGGYALGAQAGEAAIRQVTIDAGFTRFRRAAQTPFNLVYEVRP